MARSKKGRRVARVAVLPVKEAKPRATPAKPASAPPVRLSSAGEAARRLRLRTALVATVDPTLWFPPMWAFLCGAAASGHLGDGSDALVRTLIGMMMAGPILLGFAQVVHYSSNRAAEAHREPDRAPSDGHLSTTRMILAGAILLIVGLVLASILGRMVAILAATSVFLGLAYSLPPLRLERNGWFSSGVRALAFVALPWLAGTAALAADPLPPISVILAALFTIGAYGAVTVNDFTTIARDRIRGTHTMPVSLGVHGAAICCRTLIGLAQVVVAEFAITQGHPLIGGVLALLLLAQWLLQRIWIAQPEAKAQWYLSTGVLLAMVGMLVAAFGITGT